MTALGPIALSPDQIVLDQVAQDVPRRIQDRIVIEHFDHLIGLKHRPGLAEHRVEVPREHGLEEREGLGMIAVLIVDSETWSRAAGSTAFTAARTVRRGLRVLVVLRKTEPKQAVEEPRAAHRHALAA